MLVSSIWVDECPSHLIFFFFFWCERVALATEWAALVWFQIENIGYTHVIAFFELWLIRTPHPLTFSIDKKIGSRILIVVVQLCMVFSALAGIANS